MGTRLQDLRYALETIGLTEEAKEVLITVEGITMIAMLVSLSESDCMNIAREHHGFSVRLVSTMMTFLDWWESHLEGHDNEHPDTWRDDFTEAIWDSHLESPKTRRVSSATPAATRTSASLPRPPSFTPRTAFGRIGHTFDRGSGETQDGLHVETDMSSPMEPVQFGTTSQPRRPTSTGTDRIFQSSTPGAPTFVSPMASQLSTSHPITAVGQVKLDLK